MQLSIMIPSIESRRELLSTLVCGLILQCGVIKSIRSFIDTGCSVLILGFDEVEIIVAIDNKEITTGKKRSILLRLATGKYVISIDEDDYIYPYYVKELLAATKSNADCFAIKGVMTTNGLNPIMWRLSKDNQNVTVVEKGEKIYLRHTNHITGVLREIAIKSDFPDVSCGEDKGYSEGLRGLLQTEYVIHPPMYHYKYSTFNKEYK